MSSVANDNNNNKTYNISDKLKGLKRLNPNFIIELKGQELTVKYFQENGFLVPILVKETTGLGMKIPNDSFTVSDIKQCIGPKKLIKVINYTDNSISSNIKEMIIKDWIKIFNNKERDKEDVGESNLEISDTKINNYLEQPQIVKDIDWVILLWPNYGIKNGTDNYPKVQKFFNMSLAGFYSDFQMYMNGASFWFHIYQGKKVLWLISPTDANLNIYKQWLEEGKRIFLGDMVQLFHRIKLESGSTVFIPSGWIIAEYTMEDSITFSGYFLNCFSMGLQLKLHKFNTKIKNGSSIFFPFFHQLQWYALDSYVATLRPKKGSCVTISNLQNKSHENSSINYALNNSNKQDLGFLNNSMFFKEDNTNCSKSNDINSNNLHKDGSSNIQSIAIDFLSSIKLEALNKSDKKDLFSLFNTEQCLNNQADKIISSKKQMSIDSKKDHADRTTTLSSNEDTDVEDFDNVVARMNENKNQNNLQRVNNFAKDIVKDLENISSLNEKSHDSFNIGLNDIKPDNVLIENNDQIITRKNALEISKALKSSIDTVSIQDNRIRMVRVELKNCLLPVDKFKLGKYKTKNWLHLTKFEIEGLKLLIEYLEYLPEDERGVPIDLIKPEKLIKEAKIMLLDHENDQAKYSITGELIIAIRNKKLKANETNELTSNNKSLYFKSLLVKDKLDISAPKNQSSLVSHSSLSIKNELKDDLYSNFNKISNNIEDVNMDIRMSSNNSDLSVNISEESSLINDKSKIKMFNKTKSNLFFNENVVNNLEEINSSNISKHNYDVNLSEEIPNNVSMSSICNNGDENTIKIMNYELNLSIDSIDKLNVTDKNKFTTNSSINSLSNTPSQSILNNNDYFISSSNISLNVTPNSNNKQPNFSENVSFFLNSTIKEIVNQCSQNNSNLTTTQLINELILNHSPIPNSLTIQSISSGSQAALLNSIGSNTKNHSAKDCSTRRRRVRCKKCEPCTRNECGECPFCKDMKKFGGLGKMKQSCIARQCLMPILPTAAICHICGQSEIGSQLTSIINYKNSNHFKRAIDNTNDISNNNNNNTLSNTANNNNCLMECAVCWKIVHPYCYSSKQTQTDSDDAKNIDGLKYPEVNRSLDGVINENLPNSWECPSCCDSGKQGQKKSRIVKGISFNLKRQKDEPILTALSSDESDSELTLDQMKSFTSSPIQNNNNIPSNRTLNHGGFNVKNTTTLSQQNYCIAFTINNTSLLSSSTSLFNNYSATSSFKNVYNNDHCRGVNQEVSFVQKRQSSSKDLSGKKIKRDKNGSATPASSNDSFDTDLNKKIINKNAINIYNTLLDNNCNNFTSINTTNECLTSKSYKYADLKSNLNKMKRSKTTEICNNITIRSEVNERDEVNSNNKSTDGQLQIDEPNENYTIPIECLQNILNHQPKYIIRPFPGPAPSKILLQSDSLPHPLKIDIWMRIFSFLNTVDLSNCSAVSKTFKRWSLNPELWKNFSLANKTIKRVHLIAIVKRQPKNLDLSWTNCTHLQLLWLLERLPRLKGLNFSGNLIKALSSLSSSICPLLVDLNLSWITNFNDSILTSVLAIPIDPRPGLDSDQSRLRNLKILNIAGTDISGVSLLIISKTLTKLNYLNISYCINFKGLDVKYLIENMQSNSCLKNLIMIGCNQIEETEIKNFELQFTNIVITMNNDQKL